MSIIYSLLAQGNTPIIPPITNPVIHGTEGTYEGVSANPLGAFIARLWWTIVVLGALALLFYLIWGSLDWIMSEGNEEKLKNARNKITHALVGMGILAASFAIVSLLYNIFKVDILNLEWPTP